MKRIKITREAKIGLFVTVCIFALAWGINFLKGKSIFSPNNTYYTWFTSVDGLEVTNDVLINGFKVGLINEIGFEDAKAGKFLITLHIEKKYHIPRNTVAKLVSTNVMGGKAIKLEISPDVEYYSPGDTLPSLIETGLIDQLIHQMAPIKQKTEMLMSRLNESIAAFNNVFNQNNQSQLNEAITGLNSTIRNANGITAKLDSSLKSPNGSLNNTINNLESISRNIRKSNGDINKIITNLTTLSDTLAQANLGKTIIALDSSLSQLNKALLQINSGRGTAGSLVYNDSLYINLENASKNMVILLDDINKNPKKYVKFSLF